MGTYILQIHVENLSNPAALDPRFCTVSISQAPGCNLVQMQPWEVDGMAVNGIPIIAYVFFSDKCNWAFDHWEIDVENVTKQTHQVTTTANNPHGYIFQPNGIDDNDLVSVHFRVFGTYQGTGKLMRSAVDGSKLLRIGNILVRDI